MSPPTGCARCSAPVTSDAGTWTCRVHGVAPALWRPSEVSYDAFAEHLLRCGGFPTYLPWPLGPGWTVSDVAAAAGPEAEGHVRGTVTCCSGTSALDGPVDVLVVTEDPGTGLGVRVAGTAEPGAEVQEGPSAVTVRVEGRSVPLWPVSTVTASGPGLDRSGLDRSVLVGECAGRWLWLVLRPASAVLLLRDEWILRDASGTGPRLVAVPFGGPTPGR